MAFGAPSKSNIRATYRNSFRLHSTTSGFKLPS